MKINVESSRISFIYYLRFYVALLRTTAPLAALPAIRSLLFITAIPPYRPPPTSSAHCCHCATCETFSDEVCLYQESRIYQKGFFFCSQLSSTLNKRRAKWEMALVVWEHPPPSPTPPPPQRQVCFIQKWKCVTIRFLFDTNTQTAHRKRRTEPPRLDTTAEKKQKKKLKGGDRFTFGVRLVFISQTQRKHIILKDDFGCMFEN